MKTFSEKLRALSVSVILVLPALIHGQGQITGSWKYVASGGEMIMQITRENITINGQTFQYKTSGNILLIDEGYQTTSYPYSLNGNQLTLEFPGGMKLAFSRVGGEQSQDGLLPKSMVRPSQGTETGQKPVSLTGKWIYQTTQGQLVLEFISASELSLNGENTQYQLKEGSIQSITDAGIIDYPYLLNQGILTITFPDGTKIPFSRATSNVQDQQSTNQQQSQQGRAWQLNGTLCSWSGSSNSSSSYSRTQKVAFDGKGNFQFGSEAGFSSNSGIAYSGNPNVQRGTYSVGDRSVVLYFQDGNRYEVQINMRQNNGTITELMYGNTLYAKGLCDN
jgi:hypothetical protein